MLYECEVFFINAEEGTTHDSVLYQIEAEDGDEAEAEAFALAENHPSWHWEDIHKCTVTPVFDTMLKVGDQFFVHGKMHTILAFEDHELPILHKEDTYGNKGRSTIETIERIVKENAYDRSMGKI